MEKVRFVVFAVIAVVISNVVIIIDAKEVQWSPSVTSGNYFTPSSWVGGVVPTTTDTILFSNTATVTLNANVTVNEVRITSPGTTTITFTSDSNVVRGIKSYFLMVFGGQNTDTLAFNRVEFNVRWTGRAVLETRKTLLIQLDTTSRIIVERAATFSTTSSLTNDVAVVSITGGTFSNYGNILVNSTSSIVFGNDTYYESNLSSATISGAPPTDAKIQRNIDFIGRFNMEKIDFILAEGSQVGLLSYDGVLNGATVTGLGVLNCMGSGLRFADQPINLINKTVTYNTTTTNTTITMKNTYLIDTYNLTYSNTTTTKDIIANNTKITTSTLSTTTDITFNNYTDISNNDMTVITSDIYINTTVITATNITTQNITVNNVTTVNTTIVITTTTIETKYNTTTNNTAATLLVSNGQLIVDAQITGGRLFQTQSTATTWVNTDLSTTLLLQVNAGTAYLNRPTILNKLVVDTSVGAKIRGPEKSYLPVTLRDMSLNSKSLPIDFWDLSITLTGVANIISMGSSITFGYQTSPFYDTNFTVSEGANFNVRKGYTGGVTAGWRLGGGGPNKGAFISYGTINIYATNVEWIVGPVFFYGTMNFFPEKDFASFKVQSSSWAEYTLGSNAVFNLMQYDRTRFEVRVPGVIQPGCTFNGNGTVMFGGPAVTINEQINRSPGLLWKPSTTMYITPNVRTNLYADVSSTIHVLAPADPGAAVELGEVTLDTYGNLRLYSDATMDSLTISGSTESKIFTSPSSKKVTIYAKNFLTKLSHIADDVTLSLDSTTLIIANSSTIITASNRNVSYSLVSSNIVFEKGSTYNIGNDKPTTPTPIWTFTLDQQSTFINHATTTISGVGLVVSGSGCVGGDAEYSVANDGYYNIPTSSPLCGSDVSQSTSTSYINQGTTATIGTSTTSTTGSSTTGSGSTPTPSPTSPPTSTPTPTPTTKPTSTPTMPPTTPPTHNPNEPTPTLTIPPTNSPTSTPTTPPTNNPNIPTTTPTIPATNNPNNPTPTSTTPPTNTPATAPPTTPAPTQAPTSQTTPTPTQTTTTTPTIAPTSQTTSQTTPTTKPTTTPTGAPTGAPVEVTYVATVKLTFSSILTSNTSAINNELADAIAAALGLPAGSVEILNVTVSNKRASSVAVIIRIISASNTTLTSAVNVLQNAVVSNNVTALTQVFNSTGLGQPLPVFEVKLDTVVKPATTTTTTTTTTSATTQGDPSDSTKIVSAAGNTAGVAAGVVVAGVVAIVGAIVVVF